MIQTELKYDYCLVKITEKQANLENAEEFKLLMNEVIADGNKLIVLDLAEVVYVDSTFLSAMIAVLKMTMSHGGDLAVWNLNDDIANLFSLIRLDRAIKVYKELPTKFAGITVN